MTLIAVAAIAGLCLKTARGQAEGSRAAATPKGVSAGVADDATQKNPSDVAMTLKTAAEAIGLARWSGVGGQRLPEVDVVNTMEFWGSGTTYEQNQPIKAEYHVSLGYNPAAMRVELTRTPAEVSGAGGAARHAIEVVRESYAWDESEIGGGLIPGKGTATPAMTARQNRLLQLWILPYGVLKAAVAAHDKTKVSAEQGNTVITFPLGGELSGVTVKATLDGQHEVARVETYASDPALVALNTVTDYSDYADHGEILTDVKSPGHIVRTQNGHRLMDVQVKTWDANNPYLVFPVPENVRKAAAR